MRPASRSLLTASPPFCRPAAAALLGGELWILPGSRNIINIEAHFNNASFFQSDEKHKLLSFRAIITKMIKEKDLDLVLVDCSPSSSTLNKVRTFVFSLPRARCRCSPPLLVLPLRRRAPSHLLILPLRRRRLPGLCYVM